MNILGFRLNMDPIRMRIGKENRDVSSMYFIYVLVGSIPYIYIYTVYIYNFMVYIYMYIHVYHIYRALIGGDEHRWLTTPNCYFGVKTRLLIVSYS